MDICRIAGVVLLSLTTSGVQQANAGTVRLTQSIPLPGVEGRLDHLAIDLSGKRLFVCALGNNTLEVIDLQKGQRIRSIGGLQRPQGVAYASEPSRLYVANDNGKCNIYDGNSFALLGDVDFGDDADNVRYDSSAKRVYVGYGDSGIGIIDTETGKNAGSINLPKHPEAFVLEKSGRRIFVNIPSEGVVGVIDRAQHKLIATWKTDDASANFPIALDESAHRLFLGCRSPARLVVLNADSGSVVTTVAISGDADDVFYDGTRRRLYAVCGEGGVNVIEQIDRDNYEVSAKIPTASGARTGLYVPELNSLFVAIPHRGNQNAELRRYAVE